MFFKRLIFIGIFTVLSLANADILGDRLQWMARDDLQRLYGQSELKIILVSNLHMATVFCCSFSSVRRFISIFLKS